MLPSNYNNMQISDARIQSLGLKFTFITSIDKLTIQASSIKDNLLYVGEILASSYIDFEDIKTLLQQNHFKTVLKTQQILKIKIGAIPLDLFPKQQNQQQPIINNKDFLFIKQSIQQSIVKQQQLQQVIQSQNNKLIQNETKINDLTKIVNELKASPEISFGIQGIRLDQWELGERVEVLQKRVGFVEVELIKQKGLGIDNDKMLQQIKQQLQQQQKLYLDLNNQKKISIQQLSDSSYVRNNAINSSQSQNYYQLMENLLNELHSIKYQHKSFVSFTQNMKKQLLQQQKNQDQRQTIKIDQLQILINHKVSLIKRILQAQNKKLSKINDVQSRMLNVQTILGQQQYQNQEQNLQYIQQTKDILNKIHQMTNNKQQIDLLSFEQIHDYPYQFSLIQNNYKWSEQLKSNLMLTTDKLVHRNTKSPNLQFTLMKIGFQKKLKQKQSWVIKINKNYGGSIYLGICLKSYLQKHKFNDKSISWKEVNHGCYLVDSSGRCYSHSVRDFNNVQKSFAFNYGDIIYIEYDPIRYNLLFRNKQTGRKFDMSIIPPPQNDAYHPCVGISLKTILSVQASVQLIV